MCQPDRGIKESWAKVSYLNRYGGGQVDVAKTKCHSIWSVNEKIKFMSYIIKIVVVITNVLTSITQLPHLVSQLINLPRDWCCRAEVFIQILYHLKIFCKQLA